MHKIIAFFTTSFKRGPFWGALDMAFKILAILLWLFVMSFVVYSIYRTYRFSYMPTEKVWWISYTSVLTLTSSVLCYTALFIRK